MKSLSFGAAVLVGAAVFAAPASAQNFTGFRGEVHGGWDRVSVDDEDLGLDESESGLTYGIGIGYDVALGRGMIAGVEANFDLANTDFTFEADGASASIEARRDIEVSARIGALIGPGALVYGKVGYTNARLRGDFTDGETNLTFSENGDGIRLGAGMEFALSRNAYAKAEYRYSNYEGGVTRNQVITGVGFRF